MVSFALDMLFPRKCALCQRLGPASMCTECRAGLRKLGRISLPENGLVEAAFAIYTYGSAYPVVQALKYHRCTSLADAMSNELVRLAQAEGLLAGSPLVVPVPIHSRREFDRGFNQAVLLTAKFPAAMRAEDALRRVRYTPPQVGLSMSERSENVRGAFEASEEVAGRDIVLVDDVFTSGATARECARTLLAKGASSIQVLVYAGK